MFGDYFPRLVSSLLIGASADQYLDAVPSLTPLPSHTRCHHKSFKVISGNKRRDNVKTEYIVRYLRFTKLRFILVQPERRQLNINRKDDVMAPQLSWIGLGNMGRVRTPTLLAPPFIKPLTYHAGNGEKPRGERFAR